MISVVWGNRSYQRAVPFKLPQGLTICSVLCLECSRNTHPALSFAWPSPIQASHFNLNITSPERPSMTPLDSFHYSLLCNGSFRSKCVFYIQCLWLLLDCELQADREHFCFVHHCIFGANTMPGTEDVPTKCYWMCISMQLLPIRVENLGREIIVHCHSLRARQSTDNDWKNFLQSSESMGLYWISILNPESRAQESWLDHISGLFSSQHESQDRVSFPRF